MGGFREIGLSSPNRLMHQREWLGSWSAPSLQVVRRYGSDLARLPWSVGQLCRIVIFSSYRPFHHSCMDVSDAR